MDKNSLKFKLGIFFLCLLLLIVFWAYLAGGIFLAAFNQDFNNATPITLYQYYIYYGTDKKVMTWIYIASGISAFITLLPLPMFFARAKKSLHGDARFAKKSEIKKAGLLGVEKGIIVGKYGSEYLVFGGSQHVTMSAPTRSGKGVGIVIPNLLNWPDSVVVMDIKQENWDLTSGYRKKYGHSCFLFNPAAADYKSHRYNPLAYISEDVNFRVNDIQKIAGMFFADKPNTDTIWTATPRSLFLGIVLLLLETPGKPITIGQVLRETLVDGDGSKYFANCIEVRERAHTARSWTSYEATAHAEKHCFNYSAASDAQKAKLPYEYAVYAYVRKDYALAVKDKNEALYNELQNIISRKTFDKVSANAPKPLSFACVNALNTYITISAENTRSGIMTGFRSSLELWLNPIIDAATSANDFDLREIRKKPISIYIGITPDNLERLAPLVNLFFQQLIDLNTRELPSQNPSLKRQCLLVMDEFTAIGKLGILAKGISYIAGYGLRMLPIYQSPSQIIEVYGKEAATTFTANHALNVVFPPKASDLQTARDISEWLGYETVKSASESKRKGIFAKKNPSESVSDQRRALLLPQEVSRLGKNRELVVVEDCEPILATKIKYYDDPLFIDRLKEVSHSLAALGKKKPTQKQLEDAALRNELSALVPRLDLEKHNSSLDSVSVSSKGGYEVQEVEIIERLVTVDDLPNLSSLALSEFAVDFSGIDAPTNDDDIEALHRYADELCLQAGLM